MTEVLKITSPQEIDVEELTVNFLRPEFKITFISSQGTRTHHAIQGAAAVQVLRSLNKADLSQGSMKRRIFQMGLSAGLFEGEIIGEPD